MSGIPQGVHLETLRIYTVLGMRFFDSALDVPVGGGLRVQAWRADTTDAPRVSRRGPSGGYSFHELPGLRAIEYPLESSLSPASPPAAVPFIVSVEDMEGRFLPTCFGLDLPLSGRGLFPPADAAASPPQPAGRAYLFSAPTRPAPAYLAAARADLWDTVANQPAAHALLRLEVAGRVYLGISDRRGQALLLFPVPQVQSFNTGSPPGGGQAPPQEARWPARLTIRYEVAMQRFLLAGREDPFLRQVPSLRSVVEQQRPAEILAIEGGAFSPQFDTELRYGSPLTLETSFPGPAPNRFRLLIRTGP